LITNRKPCTHCRWATMTLGSGADFIWHRRALLQISGLGGRAPWIEEQQTKNWRNCNDHHESAHQNDELYM